MQDREAYGLKDLVWSSEVVEEHDEEAVVRQLVEIPMPVLMVLYQHMRNCYQNLEDTDQLSG